MTILFGLMIQKSIRRSILYSLCAVEATTTSDFFFPWCFVVSRFSSEEEYNSICLKIQHRASEMGKIIGADIGKGFLQYSGVMCLIFLVLGFQESVDGRLISISKPHPDKAAATARWLASQNFWGILSTISSDLQGAPFGNVVSFSDGEPQKSSGIPYFYLTTLDPTAKDAMKNETASFTVSEYPLGTCGKIDPENPTCAKLTLTGKLKVVDRMSKEKEYAQNALFSKHPEMKHWPKNHHFQFFKLNIENIFLIDWFGGPKPVSLEQYFHANLNEVVPVL